MVVRDCLPPLAPRVGHSQNLALRFERTLVGGDIFPFPANGQLCALTGPGQRRPSYRRPWECRRGRRSSGHRLRAGEHFAVGLVADAPYDLLAVQFQPSTPAAGRAFHAARYAVLLGWAWVRHHSLQSVAGGSWVGQQVARVRCPQPGAPHGVGGGMHCRVRVGALRAGLLSGAAVPIGSGVVVMVCLSGLGRSSARPTHRGGAAWAGRGRWQRSGRR